MNEIEARRNRAEAESLHAQAITLRQQGNVDAAAVACVRAITLRPTFALAHNTLGLCYFETSIAREALGCFEQAIALQPSFAAAHLNLGFALQMLGRNAEAAECFRRVLAIVPDSSEALEALGLTLLQERKRVEAVESFRRVLQMNPRSARAHLMLADALEQQGSSHEATDLVRKAVAFNPTSAPAHCQLGFAMLDLGDFESAISEFERAIALNPTLSDAYLGLVTSKKITEGDRSIVERMIALLNEPALGWPDRVQIHASLGKAFDDLGGYEQAIGHADEGNRISLSQDSDGAALARRNATSAFVEGSISTYTPHFLKVHANLGLETELPLFIVGLPRSGTTLVEQIVSSHSSVAAGGEIRFWEDIAALTPGGLVDLVLDESKAIAIAEDYRCLLRAIGPKMKFVTDKFNDNSFNLGFLHLLFPKVRIIHCRRNPLDNCISMYMTPIRKKPPVFRSREDILHYYEQYSKLMGHWCGVLPAGRFLEVDYEELVANSERAIGSIIEFCGLEWEDGCLRPEDNDRVVNTPSKWQARQPVYTTSVERWRRYEPWLGVFRKLI